MFICTDNKIYGKKCYLDLLTAFVNMATGLEGAVPDSGIMSATFMHVSEQDLHSNYVYSYCLQNRLGKADTYKRHREREKYWLFCVELCSYRACQPGSNSGTEPGMGKNFIRRQSGMAR